jgi:nitroreductase
LILSLKQYKQTNRRFFTRILFLLVCFLDQIIIKEEEEIMNFKEVMEGRRAVNFFDPDRDVPDSIVREMVTLASRAPSGFNLQPWSLMVLRDREKKERLKGHAWKQEKITDAPVTMIVLADTSGWKFENPFVEKNFVQLVKAGEMKEAQRDWFAGAASSLYGVRAEGGLCLQKHRLFRHVPDAGRQEPGAGDPSHGRI